MDNYSGISVISGAKNMGDGLLSECYIPTGAAEIPYCRDIL